MGVLHIKRFLIIDGHSLAHRSFHALKARLTAPDGTPTNMITGFVNMLLRVQDDLKPDCTVIVFDAGGKTFRHELLETYKATRHTMDPDLRLQLPILQDLVRYMGNYVLSRDGVEADDLAASVAKLAVNHAHEVTLLSSDKDLLSLVGSGINMMRPIKNGVSGAELYDLHAFITEYTFGPESMPDYLTITGDKADNVKGISGIGDRGAKKLLCEYAHLEKVFAALDKLDKRTRAKLQAHGLEAALWTRDNIIKLRDNLLDDDKNFLDTCINFAPETLKATQLAARLGMARVLRRLGSNIELPTTKRTFITLDGPENASTPEADIITLDYKSELKAHPERFAQHAKIWDLKTAYYMLHPDRTAQDFPEIARAINQSPERENLLRQHAAALNAQISKYKGLDYVMKNIDLPLIPVLNNMEAHGVRLDCAKFQNIQASLEARITQIEQVITNSTGVRINLNSAQQVSWLLFNILGFTPEKATRNKAAFSTQSSILEKLAKSQGGEIPALILEHRELTKMLTGFVIPLMNMADENYIIHTTFEPALTGTGRLSSHDPNLQNIPAFGQWAPLIKSGLVPVNPENVFVSADYSQIEMRVLAALSGEQKLIEAFNLNLDVHTQTAAWAFNVIPQLVTPEQRRAAKIINFGLLYGMTSWGLAQRLGVSSQQAKLIMHSYFSSLPGLRDWQQNTISQALSRGHTTTLAGRIRPLNEIMTEARGNSLERAIINSHIQGSAADIARLAIQGAGVCASVGGGLWSSVHDSLLVECEREDAQQTANIMCDVMQRAGEHDTILQQGGANVKRGVLLNLKVTTKIGDTLASV